MSALTAVRSPEYDWLVTEPVRECRPLVAWSAPGDGLSETRWRLELVPVPGYAEQNTRSQASQQPIRGQYCGQLTNERAGQQPAQMCRVLPAWPWVSECALWVAPSLGSHLLSLNHLRFQTKNWPKSSWLHRGETWAGGIFHLNVQPYLSWIPAKIRENVRGFIWEFLKWLDKPGPLPWLSSWFIISIKLTTTHFNNLVKTPASIAEKENSKPLTFRNIHLEASGNLEDHCSFCFSKLLYWDVIRNMVNGFKIHL